MSKEFHCAWCGHPTRGQKQYVEDAPHSPLCERCYKRHRRPRGGWLRVFLRRNASETIEVETTLELEMEEAV